MLCHNNHLSLEWLSTFLFVSYQGPSFHTPPVSSGECCNLTLCPYWCWKWNSPVVLSLFQLKQATVMWPKHEGLHHFPHTHAPHLNTVDKCFNAVNLVLPLQRDRWYVRNVNKTMDFKFHWTKTLSGSTEVISPTLKALIESTVIFSQLLIYFGTVSSHTRISTFSAQTDWFWFTLNVH